MTETVFSVLIKRFEEDKASALEFVSTGGAKDFAGYKEATGYIRGLETCIRNVKDLSRNYMDDDDE